MALMVIGMAIFGCASAAGQRIETDPDKWLHYKIHYADHVVTLKVPPRHIFEGTAAVQRIPSQAAEPIKQIFTAQYDYGWRRWANSSQFEVIYTFVRLETSLPLDASPATIVDAIGRVYDKKLGRIAIGSRETVAEQASGSIGDSWIHEFLQADPYVEYYAKLCAPTLILQVTATYLGRDRLADAKWFKERRALFQKMVAQVQCT